MGSEVVFSWTQSHTENQVINIKPRACPGRARTLRAPAELIQFCCLRLGPAGGEGWGPAMRAGKGRGREGGGREGGGEGRRRGGGATVGGAPAGREAGQGAGRAGGWGRGWVSAPLAGDVIMFVS